MDVGAKARHEAQVGWDLYVLPDDWRFAISTPPPSFTIHVDGGREVLRITPDGEVIAPSLEAASEAGRVFCESVREYIEQAVERRARALLADETWRALA